MDLNNLVKVKTYADKINKSVTWVYKLQEKKELKIIKIDNVNFVDLTSIK